MDLGVSLTEVAGLHVGMSPRRVAQEAARLGWRESSASSRTIEDIIQENDNTPPAMRWHKVGSLVIFDVDRPRIGTLTLNFCGKQLSSVRLSYEIAESEYLKVVTDAKVRLIALGKINEKKVELSYRVDYRPYQWGYVGFTAYKVIKGVSGFHVWEDVFDSTMCYPD